MSKIHHHEIKITVSIVQLTACQYFSSQHISTSKNENYQVPYPQLTIPGMPVRYVQQLLCLKRMQEYFAAAHGTRIPHV
jgi:hypothetical protein